MSLVWSLSIRILVLAGVLLGFATSASPGVPMPAPPPTAPLTSEGAAPCTPTAGVVKRVYDTDPGGKGAYIEFRVYYPDRANPIGEPFLVIIWDPSDDPTKARAYLTLPGREVQELSFGLLTARYQAPCEIVEQIVGSPS